MEQLFYFQESLWIPQAKQSYNLKMSRKYVVSMMKFLLKHQFLSLI